MAFGSKSGTEIPQTVVYQNYCLCKGMRIQFLEIMVVLNRGNFSSRNIHQAECGLLYMYVCVIYNYIVIHVIYPCVCVYIKIIIPEVFQFASLRILSNWCGIKF